MKHPFDELTKGLATGTSRRGLCKALAACTAGVLLSVVKADAAPCRPLYEICKHDSQCCSGSCYHPRPGRGGTRREHEPRGNFGYCVPW